MLIKDLPEVIQEVLLERFTSSGNKYDANKPFGRSYMTFAWMESPEGFNIWEQVEKGNFQPFYDFHGIKNEWVPKEGEMVLASLRNSSLYDVTFIFATKEGMYIVRDKSGIVV